MNRVFKTNTALSIDEASCLAILVHNTSHFAEKGIQRDLALEIIYFARRFANPLDIIQFFLDAGSSPIEMNLWEVLYNLEENFKACSEILSLHSEKKFSEGLSEPELRHIRQNFGF